ncbi:UNVERIFIED_CONTAM: beta-galactosidase GanA [Streptomyces canus]
MRGNPIDSETARPGRRGWWRAAIATAATIALAVGMAAPATAREADWPAPAAASAADAQTHTVTLDGYSFLVDGKRTYLWSGEFHYFRLPSPDLWRDIFQKMKAAGFNSTSLYFDWGYHSPKPGVYDFSGVRDVDKLLDMAEEAGLYVIARPAPYINAEVDSGGLPGWLTTKAENNRSDDPRFLKYADEWLTQIDRIIARHQLTNGTGSVIAYQVENEYYNGSAAARSYMQHLEDKARADGITVPLTGNNNGTFNSGAGALDVDGPDSYPQGFDCSNPSKWNGVPDISYDHPAGKPLYSPEFQGGAFDPWGGPGYDKCAELINDQFANVFYKQNIAVGATAQSFYMTYGGTNWGWLSMPQNYTSYDYGAAIRETRQLDPKYDEDKLIGYFTQSVAPLTKTDAIRATPPDDSAIVDTARMNPDTRTQFHVLRHGNSTSTAVDRTHISLDFNAQPATDTTYTWDDPDSALQYAGSWSHVADQSYTGGDYKHTESFSNKAGDSVTIPFDGTAIRWIGSKTNNHGNADVYLDGTKVATVDDSGSENQAVIFQKTGLTAGAHTLKIVVAGSHSSGSTDNYVSIDAIDVPTGDAAAEPTYPVVPQQPGTAITLDGRDSHVIVANYRLGDAQLQYSTSEIMTAATIGDRDVAVLYGDPESDGETVLRYSSKPTVTTSGGTVTSTWDPATGDLRLNYTHKGLIRINVSGDAQRPLVLLVGDKATAKTFWRQDTATGPVLVRGTHLLRTATSLNGGRTLALTGDNAGDKTIEVFTSAARVTWNGRPVDTRATDTRSLTGTIPTAAAVHLPALTNWKHAEESPEAASGFDDTSWQVADRTTTNSVSGVNKLPVLYADDYGFHTGNTWYRGRFRATGKETGIHLVSDSGGGAQAFSAWLNGTFLGSSTTGSADFTFPAGSVRSKGDNVLSVLTVNMGHEEDYNSTNGNKAARGLTSASMVGAPLTSVTWRLQGVRGGEDLQDTVRGPLSTGGLYGERGGLVPPGLPGRQVEPGHPAGDRHPPRGVLVPHRCHSGPAPRPGHLTRPDVYRRPVTQVPCHALRERLAGRQLRQLPRSAAHVPRPQRNPEPERPQQHRHRRVEPGRQHRRPRQGLAHRLRQLRLVPARRAERQPALRLPEVRDAEASGSGGHPGRARHRSAGRGLHGPDDRAGAEGRAARVPADGLALRTRRLERERHEPRVPQAPAAGRLGDLPVEGPATDRGSALRLGTDHHGALSAERTAGHRCRRAHDRRDTTGAADREERCERPVVPVFHQRMGSGGA